MYPNPFSMVYEALWDMLTARADFAAQIREGNRISFGDPHKPDPTKHGLTAADLPQVALVSTGMEANLFSTSNGSHCIRRYQWILRTDGLPLKQLHEIEWAVFCGMATWNTVLTALQFEGKRFVKLLQITGIDTGFNERAPNEEPPVPVGWSSIWSCAIRFDFATADLQASGA